jgi:prefoldin subunit 5
MKFIFIIRGHIRESFQNNKLLDFLLKIERLYDIDIYIHTWNVFSNGISWRDVPKNINTVTTDQIYEYFTEVLKHKIKHIIIEDDSKIELIGSVDGKVIGAPKKGWKNMWYGQYKITQYMKDTMTNYNHELIVNMRFDLFGNYFTGDESRYFLKLNEYYIKNMNIHEDIDIREVRKDIENINSDIQKLNSSIIELNNSIDIVNNNKEINFDGLSELTNTIEIKNEIIQKLSYNIEQLKSFSQKVNENKVIVFNTNPIGKSLKNLEFLDESDFVGIDNFYIGNLDIMLRITKKFNYNLDAILKKYHNIKYQESLLYYENFY